MKNRVIHFYDNVRYLRNLRGLDQEELSIEFGVRGGTVSGWETGKSRPNFEVLLKIAEYFEVNLDDLVYKNISDPTAVREPESSYARKMIPTDLEEARRIWNEIENLKARLAAIEGEKE